MIGLAAHGNLLPADAHQVLHRPDGKALLLQYRPLLDMQLDIGGRRYLPARNRAGIADAAQLLAQDTAVETANLQRLLQRQAAGIDQAAQHVRGIAHPFLVGEGNHRQGMAGLDTMIVQRLCHLQRCQHPIAAVISPGLGDGIEMRAAHQRRQIFFSRP